MFYTSPHGCRFTLARQISALEILPYPLLLILSVRLLLAHDYHWEHTVHFYADWGVRNQQYTNKMCVIALAQQRFLSATAPSKSSAAAYSSMSRLRDIIAPPRNYCICGIRNYLEQNRTTARHVFVHLLRRQLIVWLSNDWTVTQSASKANWGSLWLPQNAPLAPLTQFPKLLSPPHNALTLLGSRGGWQKYTTTTEWTWTWKQIIIIIKPRGDYRLKQLHLGMDGWLCCLRTRYYYTAHVLSALSIKGFTIDSTGIFLSLDNCQGRRRRLALDN